MIFQYLLESWLPTVRVLFKDYFNGRYTLHYRPTVGIVDKLINNKGETWMDHNLCDTFLRLSDSLSRLYYGINKAVEWILRRPVISFTCSGLASYCDLYFADEMRSAFVSQKQPMKF